MPIDTGARQARFSGLARKLVDVEELEMLSHDRVAVVDHRRDAKLTGNSSHGYYCSVPLCRNRLVNDPSLLFHFFPNDRIRKDIRKRGLSR